MAGPPRPRPPVGEWSRAASSSPDSRSRRRCRGSSRGARRPPDRERPRGALKVIRRGLVNRPLMLDRFLREMNATARLTHPNIVRAYDSDWIGDVPFLVLEYVQGANLDQRLAEL